jgi:hypothetical protein
MNIKEKAYQLFLDGNSYQSIANELSISKTTAHTHVKEMKILNSIDTKSYTEPAKPNSNERGRISPTKKTISPMDKKDGIEVPTFPKSKLFTGNDLRTKEFETLAFTGKFLELIGEPEKNFSGMIWGLPKGGKSNFAFRFADYLEEYFGDVLYIAVEEGESQTLKGKIEAIGGSTMTFLDTKDIGEMKKYIGDPKYSFVFIDSINRAGISDEILETIKAENPTKSIVSIVQATKGGNFKGDQALTHNCGFIIKVIDGIAHHEGRYGPESKIEIFKEPLYVKNPEKVNKKTEKAPELNDKALFEDCKMTKPPNPIQNILNNYDNSSNLTPAECWAPNKPFKKPTNKSETNIYVDFFKLYPKTGFVTVAVILASYGLQYLFKPSKNNQ